MQQFQIAILNKNLVIKQFSYKWHQLDERSL